MRSKRQVGGSETLVCTSGAAVTLTSRTGWTQVNDMGCQPASECCAPNVAGVGKDQSRQGGNGGAACSVRPCVTCSYRPENVAFELSLTAGIPVVGNISCSSYGGHSPAPVSRFRTGRPAGRQLRRFWGLPSRQDRSSRCCILGIAGRPSVQHHLRKLRAAAYRPGPKTGREECRGHAKGAQKKEETEEGSSRLGPARLLDGKKCRTTKKKMVVLHRRGRHFDTSPTWGSNFRICQHIVLKRNGYNVGVPHTPQPLDIVVIEV